MVTLKTMGADVQKDGYRLPTHSEWTHAAGSLLAAGSGNVSANLGSSDNSSVDKLVQQLPTGFCG